MRVPVHRDDAWTPEYDGDLGRYVRQSRRCARMSQSELARKAGIGRRALSELENNKPTLRMDVVNAVLVVFDLQLGPVPFVDMEALQARRREELRRLTEAIRRQS